MFLLLSCSRSWDKDCERGGAVKEGGCRGELRIWNYLVEYSMHKFLPDE